MRMWSENHFIDKVLIILIALFAVGFMLQQSMLITAAFIILVMADGFRLYVRGDATFYLLVIFAAVYIFLNGRSGIIVLGMPMAYYIGRRLRLNDGDSKFRNLYLFLAFFMALHVVLNFFYEYSRFGSTIFTTGVHYDIWSQQTSTATGIMINVTLLASLIYYLIFLEKRIFIRWAGIGVLVFLGIYNVMMGERSYFFLLAIALVGGIVLNMLLSGMTREELKLIGKIAVLVLVVYISIRFLSRFWGEEIESFFNGTYFYHRFFSENSSSGIFETERWERKAKYFSMMFTYPLGGGNIREIVGGSSHELWLDVLDYGGLPSYVLIVIYSLGSIIRAIKAFRNNYLESETRIMILIGFAAINAQFFVEPIIGGAPVLLMSYCMLDGAVKSMLKSTNRAKGEVIV